VHSLATKLFGVVFAVLLLNLGALGYANVRQHRRHLEAAQRSAAERMSDIVRRSTSYYMLRNDREALRHIVETIGQEPGIAQLRITNRHGRVAFATGRDPGADRVISVSTPIPNSTTCSNGACHAHPLSEQILGTLDVQLSLTEADAGVRKASMQFVGYSALAILLTLAAIGVLVWYFVHEPVRVLRDGTIALGRGDLGVQIPVRSSDELGELAASFNEMSRQLRAARHAQMLHTEKLTSLGKLAAVVAHEINNPLSGILTYAKLLRKWIERGDDMSAHTADMRDSLQLIENESRRCGDIVRSLLTFARVQPLNISDFDLNSIVAVTIKLVEHKLDLGNIVPRLELAPDLPLLRGDAGQIEQMLLAIVMNAIEAMPREGNLRIATSHTGDSIVLRITDDGMGIPPDILPRLFEPFTTTKEEGKGVGLGLAISKAIVDRHGGTIDVQSEVGRGTTFTITLPCARKEHP
jgi:two-component system NtrC family sensor kinase